jgi:Skp family chaperone for outer membrane proteins
MKQEYSLFPSEDCSDFYPMETRSLKGSSMKTQGIVIVILVSIIITLGIGYEHGLAQDQEQIKPTKVATVGVNIIFMKSQKHAQWQQQMDEYKNQVNAELDKMNKELEAVKADMKMRKPGSNDYIERERSSMEKEAQLKSRNEFYNAEAMLRIQRWTEQLYGDILDASAKVAKEKGFDMVVAKRQLQFPSQGMDDLMDTIRSNAILYNADHMDITDAVLAVIDGESPNN